MKKEVKPMPKTFVCEHENFDNIYFPKPPVVRKNTPRYSSCVHACRQFMDYSSDRWGRKIIPANATCPHVKTDNGNAEACRGAFMCFNGKIIGPLNDLLNQIPSLKKRVLVEYIKMAER